MIVGGNFKGVGQYEVYDVLAVYDARLFAKSQDEYLQKRSDDFKRWQAGLLKEEEEIELKEKIVCGIWVFTRLGAAIFLLCALIVFVEGTLLA